MRISDWSSDVCSSDLDPACARAPAARQGDQSGEKKCVNLLRASAFVPWLSAFPPVVRAGVYSTGTDRTNSPLRVLLRSLSHLTSRLFHPSRARLEGRHPTTPVVRPWKLCSAERPRAAPPRSEEHTSELQSLMRISYAVFCLK